MVKRTTTAIRAENDPGETEARLNIAILYQDPLTLGWASELWERVGRLIGPDDICRKRWRLSDLADPAALESAAGAAASADVLMVSLRDAGTLPLPLYLWADAWLPRRTHQVGALVALIGVPARPEAPCGGVHRFLESIARSAGLDFLPRERKLPDEVGDRSSLVRVSPTGNHARTSNRRRPPRRPVWHSR
jgi:hypothetical protein